MVSAECRERKFMDAEKVGKLYIFHQVAQIMTCSKMEVLTLDNSKNSLSSVKQGK
jgi:hypothetical protein